MILKDNDLKMLRKISLRGRVAFAIHVLMNSLDTINQINTSWEIVLSQLSSYTTTQMMDEWHESTVEYIPNTIQNIENFEEGEFEYIDCDVFCSLSKIYNNSSQKCNGIVDLVFEVGTVNLYGSLENGGLESLQELNELIKIAKDINVNIPNIEWYAKYSFHEENGWGQTFNFWKSGVMP